MFLGSEYAKPYRSDEEICLEAVKENCYALQFVENQTEEICLAAVWRNGSALAYVDAQTPEICMAAVERYTIFGVSVKYYILYQPMLFSR